MGRRRSAHRRAAWVWMLVACVHAACSPLGSGEDLVIEGSVMSAAGGAGIAGARVSLRYSNPLTHESRLLRHSTVTDASGRFTLRVDRLEGYSFPNCSVLAVWVEAAGYNAGSGWMDPPSREDPTCEEGRATTSVVLQPAQPAAAPGAGTGGGAPR